MVNKKAGRLLSLVTTMMLILSLFTTVFAEGNNLSEYNETLAAVDESDYTEESWTEYQEAVIYNEISEDDDQSTIDEKTANIVEAQDELVEVELPEGTVTTPSAITIKESIIVYDIVNGYVSGYEDGTFRPDRNITRAEIAQLLSGIVYNEGTNTFELTDISGQWYTEAVERIVKLGIMQGQGNGIFGPDKNMTRQDFAIAIVNMLDTSKAGDENLSFTDIENSYGKSSIEYLASIGVINGYEDGTFRPNGEITRAEAVAMINRLLEANLADVQADASLFSDLGGHWAENDVLTAAVIIIFEEE
jgi:hypothetical protein